MEETFEQYTKRLVKENPNEEEILLENLRLVNIAKQINEEIRRMKEEDEN